MIAYTIYIIASRSSIPQEGVKGARFSNNSFEGAVKFFMEKFSSSTTTTSSISLSTSSDSSSTFPFFLHPSSAADAANRECSSHSAPQLPAIVVPPSQITGRRKAEYLHTHFYLNSYEESEVKLLDEMWLKPIVHVGELVSGDEKVFHFTGNHMNTKAVKQKTEVQ